jgi:hypothetical protein
MSPTHKLVLEALNHLVHPSFMMIFMTGQAILIISWASRGHRHRLQAPARQNHMLIPRSREVLECRLESGTKLDLTVACRSGNPIMG